MATSIPLNCNICPKKPMFSDVSHLLTHVASKGHLSNYYKVKVRSATDSEARNTIDTFDRWYADWGVEDLMSERLTLKDKKRPRTRATVSTRGSSAANTPKTGTAPRTRTATSRLNNNSNSRAVPQRTPSLNALDPRLVGPNVKSEPTATPPLRGTASPTMMQPMHRLAHAAANGSPYLSARGVPMPYPYNSTLDAVAGRRDSLFDMAESTESPRSYTYPEPPRQGRYTDLPAVVSPSPPPNSPSTPTRTSTPERRDVDNSRLKGVLWPGMDIFDSATPTARRRRNQKKDASILEQLEASSLEVQPTESIWLPDGELKKERPITGDVDSSSSPWKSTPPRPEEERPPLAEVPIRKPYFGCRRGQLDSRSYNTYADDLAEQRLNYSTVGKRKRPFQVYKDHDSDPEEEDEEEPRATLTRPAPISYLTRGLGKENEQQAPIKQEQYPFASRFNGNSFERHSGDDGHQFRPAIPMDEYGSQHYPNANNLFRLADAAATSTPFQANTGMSSGYYNTTSAPYGLGYASQYLHHPQMSSVQQQHQYAMHHQLPYVHAGSHMRSLSATAGPMHNRSLSNGLHPLGMSQQHFGAYAFGHGHSYQPMDQPSMFSSNHEIWGFSANGGMYEHGSRSGSGSVFDHPTPAAMPGSLAASPVPLPEVEEGFASPGIHKVDDDGVITHVSEDHELPVDETPTDQPSCGQPEGSDDENRTITAPGTPYA